MGTWTARRTLLIVGEGDDEVAFLRHVKQLYVSRGCGLMVTIKNAHGKGAQHVIKWTARQTANAAYDSVAVLLDTDTDWSTTVTNLARTKRIQILRSDPCFEALMLRLLGETPIGNAKTLKRKFAPFVNDDSTQPHHYAAYFDTVCLETGRLREPTIDALLKLMGK